MRRLTITIPAAYHARVGHLLAAIERQAGARLTMGQLLAAALQATDDRSILAGAIKAQEKLKNGHIRVRRPALETLRRHLRRDKKMAN